MNSFQLTASQCPTLGMQWHQNVKGVWFRVQGLRWTASLQHNKVLCKISQRRTKQGIWCVFEGLFYWSRQVFKCIFSDSLWNTTKAKKPIFIAQPHPFSMLILRFKKTRVILYLSSHTHLLANSRSVWHGDFMDTLMFTVQHIHSLHSQDHHLKVMSIPVTVFQHLLIYSHQAIP